MGPVYDIRAESSSDAESFEILDDCEIESDHTDAYQVEDNVSESFFDEQCPHSPNQSQVEEEIKMEDSEEELKKVNEEGDDFAELTSAPKEAVELVEHMEKCSVTTECTGETDAVSNPVQVDSLSITESFEILDDCLSDGNNTNLSKEKEQVNGSFLDEQCSHSTSRSQAEHETNMDPSEEVSKKANEGCIDFAELSSNPSEPAELVESVEKCSVIVESDPKEAVELVESVEKCTVAVECDGKTEAVSVVHVDSLLDTESVKVLDDGVTDGNNTNASKKEDNVNEPFMDKQCLHSTSRSQEDEEMKMEAIKEVLVDASEECNNFAELTSPSDETLELIESLEKCSVAVAYDGVTDAVLNHVDKAQDDHDQERSSPKEPCTSNNGDEAKDKIESLVEMKPTYAVKKVKCKPKPVNKLTSKSGEEYIKKDGPTASKIPQLGFSARLMYGNMELMIYSKGCLMVTDDNFVAKVKLAWPQTLQEARYFQHAAEMLLDQLRIDDVLIDDLTADRNKLRESLLSKLEYVIKQISSEQGQICKRIELIKFIERSKQCRSFTYADLCRELMKNRFQCGDLQEHARDLISVEQKAFHREQLFCRFRYYPKDPFPSLSRRLDELAEQFAEHYRKSLYAEAPAYLHRSLNNLSLKHLMIISGSDVKLFTDMSSVLRADIFEKPLQDLAKRWINRVRSINVGRLHEPLQLTSVSLFYLCKSLEDVIVEMTERTDHQVKDLLSSSDLGWYPAKAIVWKSQNALTRCIQREYYFLFRLLKHFEVTAGFGRQPFQYDMQLLSSCKSSSGNILSGVKNALVRTGRVFGYSRPEPNPFGVPDDFYVWYCLLDDALYHVLPNGCAMDMYDSVFEGYEQMVRDSKYDQMETLRVVTHNLARYIAQSYSCGGRTPLNISLDNAVLRKQLDIFSFKTSQNIDTSKSFRDQLEVFNSFWKTRNDIIDQFSSKINLPEMELMQQRLMDIMLIVLDKDVDVDTRVAFFRTYNDFLIDLNDVSFDWYIKIIPEVDMESLISLGKVALVDNKWKDTNNRTYQVLDPESFSAFISMLTKNVAVPKHYVIDVVQSLLDYIGCQLQRIEWVDDRSLSVTDQVVSTNELICAIRNSLLYLKEQVDYVSFDLFYDERVKPFASVLETTASPQDFSNRINLIKESFWYIRKQNEINIDNALQLYGELNSAHDSQLLRETYGKYSEFFDEFMQLCVHKDYSERASFIAEKVKELLPNPIQIKTWDERFKQDQVPQILAGLGAVWSILVSKDVANAGKYFNPHCIQILCILRLLSVNKAKGIDKHLAQVLTGQGKSLVLGLLAALFALTGHKVRIACYSEYLAKRDKQDFLTFYEIFDVAEKITYGTFRDLANEIIAPTVNDQKIELRDLVGDLLFKQKAVLPHRLVEPDSSNDILLMDEVDVFFTKEFYGNKYNPCTTPLIPGVACIQEQIWRNEIAGVTDVERHIRNFIQSDEFKHKQQFNEFLERPNIYNICKYGDSPKTYTNKTLFDEQLGMMVSDAKCVNSYSYCRETFKLNSYGIITQNRQGVYENQYLWGYYNVFNYFRLKKENFVTQVGESINYGYLLINCGSLSYAMLPMNYPLIVGVSGTLTSLNQYEKDTIQQLYNIRETSVMPTFFGCSNLKFDVVSNFHHHATRSSWRNNIFSQANQIIAANRAVIIFFETDVQLDAFKVEYAGQLDRVNVLTENTDDKERFISEAGVAKTITLATRGMGRGVDYKSSVTVEKNGGVHIIQTFFSMDVKEETQIKGRTARKDNGGSYELIVCDADLQLKGLCVNDSSFAYAELDAARGKISLDENERLSTDIKNSMKAHKTTMRYMKTFFKN